MGTSYFPGLIRDRPPGRGTRFLALLWHLVWDVNHACGRINPAASVYTPRRSAIVKGQIRKAADARLRVISHYRLTDPAQGRLASVSIGFEVSLTPRVSVKMHDDDRRCRSIGFFLTARGCTAYKASCGRSRRPPVPQGWRGPAEGERSTSL